MANKEFVVKNGLLVSNTVLVVTTGNRVGVNTATPDTLFQIVGNANVVGDMTVTGILTANIAGTISVGVINVGSNVYINSSTYFAGNTTIYESLNSISITFTNNTTNTVISAGNINVGSNVYVNTSSYFVGNSTVYTIITASNTALGGGVFANGSAGIAGQVLTTGGPGTNVYWSTVAGGGGTPGGSTTQVQFNDAGSFGGNGGFTYTKTTNTVAIANTLTLGGSATVANTLGVYTGIVNAATHSVGALFTANSTLVNAAAINITGVVNAAAINITGAVNTATLMATGLANVNSLNSVGAVNAASGNYTGTVNAATHSVGALFTANSTLVNAAAINITGAVNTATLVATGLANVNTLNAVSGNFSGAVGSANLTVTGYTQLQAVREQANTVSATGTIDLSLGTYFSKTITAANTFVVTNAPASSKVLSFILELTNGGSQSITWMTGTKWAAASPPILSSSGVDLLVFVSRDGGTTFYGVGSIIGAA